MTNNFKILNDFCYKRDHEAIKDKIKEIENDIKNKEYRTISYSCRFLVELILKNNLNKENTKLDLMIREFININAAPSLVKNSLYYIKQKGNIASHPIKKSDTPYEMQSDIFSFIELLKNIFVIIKYTLQLDNEEEFKNIDDIKEEYKFISAIYFPMTSNNDLSENKDVVVEDSSMETKMKGIFQLITSEYKIHIPTYQREYNWSRENIEILLQDIEDRNKDKETHYMGALAISLNNDKKAIRLIDGQQRITTTLILIKAVINIFEERSVKLPSELDDIAQRIKSIYVNKVSSGDLNDVSTLLSGRISDSPTRFKKSNAKLNYDIIETFLKDKKTWEINEYITTFIHKFVIAELKFKNEIENEIQIFENLNSKGLELSQWDLVKNYIYKKIDFNLLYDNEIEIERMINRLFVVNSSIAFGRKKFDELSKFLSFYSRIKYMEKNGKALSDKGKIHKIFASVWPMQMSKFTSTNELKTALLPIARFFKIYSDIKSREYTKPISYLYEFRLHLENLSQKDAHFSLLMSLINEKIIWSNDLEIEKFGSNEVFFNYISAIDKYISRLLIVSNVGQSLGIFFDLLIDKNVDHSYEKFIKKIQEKGLQTSLSDYKEFQNEINKKTNWQPIYAQNILRTLEMKNHNSDSGRHNFLYAPTLEHIFPRKATEKSKWKSLYPHLSFKDFSLKMAEHINMLGNYIILDNKLNIKASNHEFEKKLLNYKKDKNNILIKGIPNNGLMNLFNKTTFNFKDIEQRTKQLTELVAPLYKFDFEK